MEERAFWIAFNRIPGIGRAKYALLEKHFGSLEDAWRAGRAELKAAGLEDKPVATILALRPRISPEAEIENLERHGVRTLTWRDTAYPARLKEIYDLPPILYLKGPMAPEDDWALAVVGTRKATVYGREVAEALVADLAKQRITIVSGLARGIDAVAHRAALASGGRTIGVLASGLDIIYPAEHSALAAEIVEHGVLMSEYPLGTRPKAENFPRRNRILSGLSLGVLVVEAGETSGAMHTVNWALEQNREVFAVPGAIFSPASRGTNRLIQDGAKLVLNYQDILAELNLSRATQLPLALPQSPAVPPPDDREATLLRSLSTNPIHIDELRRTTGLPISQVSSTLALMELKGMVKQVGNMSYILTRESNALYGA